MTEAEILARTSFDHETWNSCVVCSRVWKDTIPTPGVLHRSVMCDICSGIYTSKLELTKAEVDLIVYSLSHTSCFGKKDGVKRNLIHKLISS
jgi:hypothetical protein